MVKTTLFLHEYDWVAYVFYVIDECHPYPILDKLRQIGADKRSLFRAHKSLMEGASDVVYTNEAMRKSVVVMYA